VIGIAVVLVVFAALYGLVRLLDLLMCVIVRTVTRR
jgi:hypothetical protein